jgi:DNA gyrase/topoisomerase IV subunit B
MWVFDQETNQMNLKPCTFVCHIIPLFLSSGFVIDCSQVPGLYKIFDEIIVNAADNKQRDPSMNRLEVDINPDENSIRVWNNGNGIPVVIHQEHNIYVPELIFGHLLTGLLILPSHSASISSFL